MAARTKAMRAVERFELAVRAHDSMGAQHPHDWPLIVSEYERAKANLVQHLVLPTPKPAKV